MRRAPFDLMLVVDPRQPCVLDALARLGPEVGGERVAVQLRAKDASEAALIDLARALAAVQPPMSRLIVNGSVAVARAIAADGVHLPETGGAADDARARLALGALVGASCHDAVGLARRAAEGVDYALLGPLGDVPGKPAMSPGAFAEAARSTALPIIALGGIRSADDASRALDLGAAGIALQRALLDPGAPAWIARWLAGRIGA